MADPSIEEEVEKTPYEWLDVPRNADSNTIRVAYTKLILQHHPDRGGDKDTFDAINQVTSSLGAFLTFYPSGPRYSIGHPEATHL